MLGDSVENDPYKFKSEITVKDTNGVTDIRHAQRQEDLVGDEKLHYDSDIKYVNILLFGLPVDIYSLINHYQTAKEIQDCVKELMEGTEMDKQEHYNGEGHMAKQCTTRKRVKDFEWFKDKMLLAQAQEARAVLDEEQRDFLADSLEETNDCEYLQLQATTNFKADYVDAYDLDCNDKATTNAIFIENLSPVGSFNDDTVVPPYDSDTLSKDLITTSIKILINDEDNYVRPPVQKNDMMLSVIEQMKSQVEKCNKKTYNNDKNLSEIQLEHEKEDGFVMVVVKVVHECKNCKMVVKEIVSRILEEEEKLEWWFEQDIDDEGEENEECDGGSELEDVGKMVKIQKKR
uniref:Zinc finger, CCHC-type n=1 Tax=Tanacetum cinerariifolium TaxID=118510 RepID=A0A699H5S9_TANCI|nr:hypothetical protein [Tanacetum cinerariifolium]